MRRDKGDDLNPVILRDLITISCRISIPSVMSSWPTRSSVSPLLQQGRRACNTQDVGQLTAPKQIEWNVALKKRLGMQQEIAQLPYAVATEQGQQCWYRVSHSVFELESGIAVSTPPNAKREREHEIRAPPAGQSMHGEPR